MIATIDGALFQRMIIHAAASIQVQKQSINELNVFPVPDGDTGTNMSLTISTSATEMKKKPASSIGQAASVNASALLRGARGNSGVILSLLFRGVSKALKEADEADGVALAAALSEGVTAVVTVVVSVTCGSVSDTAVVVSVTCGSVSDTAIVVPVVVTGAFVVVSVTAVVVSMVVAEVCTVVSLTFVVVSEVVADVSVAFVVSVAVVVISGTRVVI